MPISTASVDNANAGVFFSTAALLIGVLVTVVGAALAQVLLDGSHSSDVGLRPRRRRNLIVLAVVILVDLWGVGFPLYALYRSALGSTSPTLVKQVFFSTVAVGIANILFPLYVINILYSIQYWYSMARLGLSRGERRAETLREMLVKGGYVEEGRYDALVQEARSDNNNYESTIELLGLFNECLILGRRGRISSPFRTVAYYYFKLFIPLYVRSVVRKGEHAPPEDPTEPSRESAATGTTGNPGGL
jgi:hypothetical protein